MASDIVIPVYLDFTDLRNEGITHLGNLTGRIWTDYNVHDPGITMLEVLCYALLDLDYRSKLPAADLFARNPSATGPDNNFYSPAQILACNPLTIPDYRKLLSDIEGVRNAWLEVATDNVNGLYHIYLELEDGVDQPTMLATVRQSLNTHRNLCEDIADIIVVGKQRLGVCAIVELDTDADPVQVYLDMMTALGNFLSPSPHFYTLQEMLDKSVPIDTIFAGRPYDTSTSHGFIDPDELAQIQLKKEVHLSDLYKALFTVSGIATIRDLLWKPCNGTPNGAWKYNIPQNNVVDFSPDCCGIQFLRNGKPVPFDATQYEALLQVTMKKNLYTTALPNLDLAYPAGNFHDDLADYYSIQNDFPNAYGIAKGGLPDDAPLARKAWALQLKGFLLFFDQLLADYLAQLSNIRDLFSMGGNGGGHTYFLNNLDNGDDPDGANYVPDVDKLWRSYVDNDLAALLGSSGSTLVAPGSLTYTDWNEMQDAITRLKADFEAGTVSVVYTSDSYTITTSSPDMVMVCAKTFVQKADAQKHAAYVLNNGMLDSTYSLFSTDGSHFTFTLQYNATPVSQILQADLEDPALYARRRQYFLDHLLSRFAEKFTDYALLTNSQNQIGVEENYLSQYAVLSSQRGQAGGFQKKWKALIGANSGDQESLCNFNIQQFGAQYRFSLVIGGKTFFQPTERYNSEEDARQGAGILLKALADRGNYSATNNITVAYGPGLIATLVDTYPTDIEAATIADRLALLFSQRPSQRDVFASSKPSGTFYRNPQKTDAAQFIDLDAFKIDINDTIVDKPDKFTYDVLPVTNAFKLQAADEFASADEAMTHAKELLFLAADSANYTIEEDKEGLCTIWISSDDHPQASYHTGLQKAEAEGQIGKMADLFRQQILSLPVGNEPGRWKFHYYLGYENNSRISFDSIADYESSATAMDALRLLWQQAGALHIQQEEVGLTLRADDLAVPAALATAPAAGATAPTAEAATPLLQLNQEIQKAVAGTANYATTALDDISQQGAYTWQAVNIDQRAAFCTRDYTDKTSADVDKAKLADLLLQGVKYLEICLDGTITRRRKDPVTGEFGFHFQVKCHNYSYSSGKPLVLLESVKGYPTDDAAKQAFTDNYIPLLTLAAQESNYGTLISLTEIISNTPPPTGPQYFVPKETKVSLGGIDTDVIKKLADMAGSFPIKRAECPAASNADPCVPGTTQLSYTYYCGLTIPNPNGASFVWVSTCAFKTIAEAQLDFVRLIRLLRYPGNLFTDTFENKEKAGSWRIFIREVLAESPERFKSEDDAWGVNGVERFICALREKDSVLMYQQNDCSNTFLVNCGQPALLHPTTYSTPATRDEAKQLLVDQAGKWNSKAFNAARDGDFILLNDGQGVPFAKAPISNIDEDDIILITDLLENTVVIQPINPDVKPEDLKAQLELFADQYPFAPTADGRFSVELILPPAGPSAANSSSIAWQLACLYNTSADAQSALENAMTQLAHSDYYLSTFTTDCRCFGIAYSDPADKVAMHPLSYNSRDTVIDVVKRMRAAVDTEGLHLVEHILLRPRPGHPEDDACRSVATCATGSGCEFQWNVMESDPCAPPVNASFLPGSDPWSFIATVVLPAWPDKFGEQDNKIVLENALYREAPAHVLLRVLWLTPRDCHHFEVQYRAWVKGLAAQKNADADFSACDFVNYFFTTKFETPADCQPCHPCPAPVAVVDPCTTNLKSSRAKQAPVFSGQVSELFCWGKPAPVAEAPAPITEPIAAISEPAPAEITAAPAPEAAAAPLPEPEPPAPAEPAAPTEPPVPAEPTTHAELANPSIPAPSAPNPPTSDPPNTK